MTQPAPARLPVVLASTSPRRLDLLARLGITPARIAAPAIDEAPHPGELPIAYARRLAREKAAAVDRAPGSVIVAGDTTIALGRRILPPADDAEVQRALLTRLSGRRHHCHCAVAVIDAAGVMRDRVATTLIAFKPLSTAEIDRYIAGGEGLGKAGGYAIQGFAEAWVRRLDGSHSGVIGLPLYETRGLLIAAGVLD